MVKKNESVYTKWECTYCKNNYYSEEDATECEKKHTPVGVGSVVQYWHEYTAYDHGKTYRESCKVTRTIVAEKDDEFLMENDKGERKWIGAYRVYRCGPQ